MFLDTSFPVVFRYVLILLIQLTIRCFPEQKYLYARCHTAGESLLTQRVKYINIKINGVLKKWGC